MPRTERLAERGLIAEAEHITGLRPRTIQGLAAAGKIPGAARLGRRWTFDILALRAWVRAEEDRVVARRDQFRPERPAFNITIIDNVLERAIAEKLRRQPD